MILIVLGLDLILNINDKYEKRKIVIVTAFFNFVTFSKKSGLFLFVETDVTLFGHVWFRIQSMGEICCLREREGGARDGGGEIIGLGY